RCLYEKKGSAKTFKIVDAGMNDLIRPALYEGHHEIVPLIQPKTPQYKPIQTIWQYLNGHGMAGYLTISGAELGEKLFEEVRLLINDTDTIRSVCTVKLA
ncbi:MAG: hypothetical protein ACK572_09690, partial [Akkermansiaceae bacterium]